MKRPTATKRTPAARRSALLSRIGRWGSCQSAEPGASNAPSNGSRSSGGAPSGSSADGKPLQHSCGRARRHITPFAWLRAKACGSAESRPAAAQVLAPVLCSRRHGILLVCAVLWSLLLHLDMRTGQEKKQDEAGRLQSPGTHRLQEV